MNCFFLLFFFIFILLILYIQSLLEFYNVKFRMAAVIPIGLCIFSQSSFSLVKHEQKNSKLSIFTFVTTDIRKKYILSIYEMVHLSNFIHFSLFIPILISIFSCVCLFVCSCCCFYQLFVNQIIILLNYRLAINICVFHQFIKYFYFCFYFCMCFVSFVYG